MLLKGEERGEVGLPQVLQVAGLHIFLVVDGFCDSWDVEFGFGRKFGRTELGW